MAELGPERSQVDGNNIKVKQEQCEMCEEKESAGHCSQCELYICKTCFDRHIKSRQCKNHILLNAPENNLDALDQDLVACAEHVNQTIRFYCTEHECFGCGDCMLFSHKKCKCEYISEAYRKFQESGDLDSLIENINSLETKRNEFIDVIDSQTEASVRMENSAIHEITEFTESLISYMTEAKMHAIKEVERKRIANKKMVDKLKDDVGVIESQLNEIRAAFQNEKQAKELFILAIESKPKLAAILNTFNTIDRNVITKFSFRPSKVLKDFATNAWPIGSFTDTSQDDEYVLETELMNEHERVDMMCQQLRSHREKTRSEVTEKTDETDNWILRPCDIKTEIQEGEYHTMETTNTETTLLCGHKGTSQMMTCNRTIRCDICNMIHGDQPDGTIQSTVKDDNGRSYLEIIMRFQKGSQSQLNVEHGDAYRHTEHTCYLANNREGKALLKMLKEAFERRLIFTTDNNGDTVPGVIEIFRDVPWECEFWRGLNEKYSQSYIEYTKRLRKQLANVGIAN